MTRLLRPLVFALLVLAACQAPAPGVVAPDNLRGLATAAIETTKLDVAPVGNPIPAKPVTATNAATDAATDAATTAATNAATTAVTVQVPGRTTPRPKARPAALTPVARAVKPQVTAAPDTPVVLKLPGQLACEKSRGTWVTVGDAGFSFCQRRTRDGGRQCTRKTQCEGECLSRSGTCSPVTPLFGCTDVLDEVGRMMTNCLQ